MNLEYAPRYEDFRLEVRAFLDAHKPEKSLLEAPPAERARWLTFQIARGYWARHPKWRAAQLAQRIAGI